MLEPVRNFCSFFSQNYSLHFNKRAAVVVKNFISVRGFAAFASIGAAVFLYKRFIFKQQQGPNSLKILRYLKEHCIINESWETIDMLRDCKNDSESGLLRQLVDFLITQCLESCLARDRQQLKVCRNLELKNLKLDGIPANFLSWFPNLQWLNLSHNELTNLLSGIFSNLHNVEELDLSSNKLLTLPPGIFSNLHNLKELDLSHNELLTLPPGIFSNLHNLEKLDLSRNKLLTLPRGIFSNLRKLKQLRLSYNQLDELPSDIFSPLVSLERLDLSNNELIALPDSLLTLPSDCQCSVDGNRLSPESAVLFQQAISERGELAPRIEGLSIDDSTARHSNTVQEEVAIWMQRFQTQFPKDKHQEEWNAHFANIPDTSQSDDSNFLQFYGPLFELNSLHMFLEHLEKIADFRSQSTQGNVILKIARILVGAVQNEAFREKLDAISADATGACGDRIDMGLGRLELWWKIHCGNMDRKEVAKAILGIKRTAMLDQHVKDMAKANNWGDEIEFVLYFRIKLNDLLGLQITTKGMLYSGMVESVVNNNELQAMLTNIGQEVLKQSSGVENIVNILVESDIWGNVIEKSQPELFKEIRDEAQTALADLENKKETMTDDEAQIALEDLENKKATMTDGDYLHNIQKIQGTMKQKIQELTKKLTEQWVNENQDWVTLLL